MVSRGCTTEQLNLIFCKYNGYGGYISKLGHYV